MPAGHKDWTRDEHTLTFNLYCKIPFGRQHSRAPEIIDLAKPLGRFPRLSDTTIPGEKVGVVAVRKIEA